MKINRLPESLVRKSDGSTVSFGEILGTEAGHTVYLQNYNENGGLVQVSEVYWTTPDSVGLAVRPAAVTMEMSPEEADFLAQISALQLKAGQVTAPAPPPPKAEPAPAAQPDIVPGLKAPKV